MINLIFYVKKLNSNIMISNKIKQKSFVKENN